MQVVVFETLQHYWCGTNILLELGLIDKVVFTAYDAGDVSSSEGVNVLEDKNVYFAGQCNIFCLSEAIYCVRQKTSINLECAIADLCLNHPNEGESLSVSDYVEAGRYVDLSDNSVKPIELSLTSLNSFYKLFKPEHKDSFFMQFFKSLKTQFNY